ncbi:glycosyltransferase, partial [Natronococcus sp.]|uniref:glycosyltransferase n=1 Tax=Natronococcus sp. TaxID=35747 RepID=UPI003A4D2F8B
MEHDGARAETLEREAFLSMSERTRDISADEVCILIPTLNEAATVGDVIDGFREQGYSNVVVVDGDSDDDTRTIARERGAQV